MICAASLRAFVLAAAALGGSCGPAAAPPSSPPPPAPVVAIGWDHVPRAAGLPAREATEVALRLEGEASGAGPAAARRLLASALVALDRALELEPDHLEARFRRACVLARLGRSDEAFVDLRAVLACDHPSFAPRLDAEPALAPLASEPAWAELAAYRRVLEARWDEALAAGAPVVWVPPREEVAPANEELDPRVRRAMQAGVWLPRARRFVPMGPRLAIETPLPREELVLAATVLDPAQRAVLLVEGEGSWSDVGPLGAVRFLVLDAGRGTERARFVAGEDGVPIGPPARLTATASGGVLRFVEDAATGPVSRVRAVGPDPAEATPRPALVVDRARVRVDLPRWSPGGLALDGDRVRLGAGRAEAPLPPAHHAAGGPRFVRWAPRDEHSDWLLTAALAPDGWGEESLRRPALSLVGVASGTLAVTLLRSDAEGPAALLLGEREAYAQLGARIYRLTASTDPEALPEGLRLLPADPATD